MNELVKVFVVSYALTMDLLPFKTINKGSSLHLTKLIVILLATLALLAVVVILLPFILFRLCVRIVTKIYYGDLHGGMLNGVDMIFEMNSNKTVINTIILYSSKDEFSVMISFLMNRIKRVYHSSFKFASQVRQIFGYCFYLKRQVPLEDITDVVRLNEDEYMTRNMLYDYMEKNCSGISKNQMWKVVLFSQPILWNENYGKDGMKQYAVICTVRHSLCDGPALLSLLQKFIMDAPSQSVDAGTGEKNLTKESGRSLDDVYVQRNPLTTKLDGSSLMIDGKTDWYIASFVERKPRYVPMIRNIKRKLGVRFVEVISAAIFASVRNYIKQRNATPNNLTMWNITRLHLEDISKFRDGVYDFDFYNDFSMLAAQLPNNSEERSVTDIIGYLHGYNESLRRSVDPLFPYMLLQYVFTYLPTVLIRILVQMLLDTATIGVSNLIGVPTVTAGGYAVEDILFFIPEYAKTGFVFYVFTYEQRFQILLVSRAGYVHDRNELQQILDNVFTYIDEVEREVVGNISS